MLRLGQSTTRICRGVNVTIRNDALLPSSERQQHGMSTLRALGSGSGVYPRACSSGKTTNSDGSSRTSCSERRSDRATKTSNVCASRGRHTYPSVAYRPGMLSASRSSKRLMSTSTGAGKPDASETGSNGAATASTDLGTDAMASASDAAMAAAGTADQVRCYLCSANDDSRGT